MSPRSRPSINQGRSRRSFISAIPGTRDKYTTDRAQSCLSFKVLPVEIWATNLANSRIVVRVSPFEFRHDVDFAPDRLDLDIENPFGHPIKPGGKSLVPLPAIDEAVKKDRRSTIFQHPICSETHLQSVHLKDALLLWRSFWKVPNRTAWRHGGDTVIYSIS